MSPLSGCIGRCLMSLMVLALFVVPSTRADCTNKTLDDTELDKQEKALNTFYDALNGDFWRINTDWDSTGNDGTGECLSVRYGVGTDSTSALVDEIFLPHNCLSGTIPKAGTAIAALSSLTRLNVVGNSIVSSLPDSFITLKNLVTLEMSSNSISGDLPAGFEFQKTNLLVLDLAYNSFTGSIPMSQWMDPESGMPQLGALFLNHNSFSGSLVTVPLSQTKFTRLEISNNKFTGPVPRYFASSLKYLDMGFNQFTGRLANNGNGLGRCKDLSYIDISNNDITGPLPSADFEILKLKNFEFTYNSLTGTVPDSISKSTDLSALRFSTNCFSGSLPSGIGELVALTKLEAMDTTLGGPIPATIGNLTNLVYVNFQNSQLTGTVPVSLSKLGRNLQYFNAFGNSLTGSLPSELSSLSRLGYLDFAENSLEPYIPASYCRMNGLFDLVVGDMEACYPPCLAEALSFEGTRGSGDNRNTKLIGKCQSGEDLTLCEMVSSITVPETAILSTESQTEVGMAATNEDGYQDTFYNDYFSYSKSFEQVDGLSTTISFDPRTDRDAKSAIDGNCKAAIVYHGYYGNATHRGDYGKEIRIPLMSSDGHLAGVEVTFEPTRGTFDVEYECDYCEASACWGWAYTITTNRGRPTVWECGTPSDDVIDTNLLAAYGISVDDLNNTMASGRCDWPGITCGNEVPLAATNNADGKSAIVQKIELEGFLQLTGTLPPALGSMVSLELLSLRSNSFTGSLPRGMSAMGALSSLDVSYNFLTGTMPRGFSALTSLRYLSLSMNCFSGTIPSIVTSMPQLTTLVMTSNKFSGTFPADLCNISSQLTLDMSNNADMTCYADCWANVSKSPQVSVGSVGMLTCTGYASVQAQQAAQARAEVIEQRQAMFEYVGIPIILLVSIALLAFAYNEFREYRKLAALPIHRAIVSRRLVNYPKEQFQKIIKLCHERPETIMTHYRKKTAVDLLIERSELIDADAVIVEMIKAHYPDQFENVKASMKKQPSQFFWNKKNEGVEMVDNPLASSRGTNASMASVAMDDNTPEPQPAVQNFVWVKLVQNDDNIRYVENVLVECESIEELLVKATDEFGRSIINIASPLCQEALKLRTYFCRKFEILTEVPAHKSQTSMVFLAYDHSEFALERSVALKFMRNRTEFDRELSIRQANNFDATAVISVLGSVTANTDDMYERETEKRGWFEYPYCLMMPAADRNLADIFAKENVCDHDWSKIKSIAIDLVKALDSLHQRGVIHGDIKPLNIMRVDGKLKLIDLDASVRIGKDPVGAKYSSAYVPPEMIEKVDDLTYLVKTYSSNSEENAQLPYNLVTADAAHDIWSLGVVFYEMCCGKTLFLTDSHDNIDEEEMLLLHDYTSEFKLRKINKIPNLVARNLISQMLSKDPASRPRASQILAHPFLSGKNAPRMIGQAPEYDVFLSYRVASDSQHAEMLYEKFRNAGLKVWWDKKCLLPGVSWKDGFCDGLVKSRIFLPLLSRGAVNDPTNDRANFTKMHEDSPCDNVLLEHNLALELFTRGLIEKIFPVMIGDVKSAEGGKGTKYGNYFSDGCDPNLRGDVVVKSVTESLAEHLDRVCLGSAMLGDLSISKIKADIMVNQGRFIQDSLDESLKHILQDVVKMMNQLKSSGKERLSTVL